MKYISTHLDNIAVRHVVARTITGHQVGEAAAVVAMAIRVGCRELHAGFVCLACDTLASCNIDLKMMYQPRGDRRIAQPVLVVIAERK